MVHFGELGRSDALTLVHSPAEDKLTCSGTLEATDVRIAGTSTTMADLIREVAAFRQEMADMKQFVGMMPPPVSPPLFPPPSSPSPPASPPREAYYEVTVPASSASALCLTPNTPGQVATLTGVMCDSSGRILWNQITTTDTPRCGGGDHVWLRKYSESSSSCWARYPDITCAQWNAEWMGACGISPTMLPDAPTRMSSLPSPSMPPSSSPSSPPPPLYGIGDFNQNVCPFGYVHILDEGSCRAAASTLGKITLSDFINDNRHDRPNGCFDWVNGAVYFNTLTSSEPTGTIAGAPLCIWAESEDSPPPTR